MYKRIFSLALLLAICMSAAAQSSFRWGVNMGTNISKYYFKQDLVKNDQVVGAELGIKGEFMFSSLGIGIDFGMNWCMHGSKLHFGEYPVFTPAATETSYLHSLQFPISLRYKYVRMNGFEEKLAPFVYAGPVFNITVGHNKVAPLEYSGGCVALQCGLGAEIFRHWQVSAGYLFGMTYEVRTLKLDNYSARNSGWKVNVVYFF